MKFVYYIYIGKCLLAGLLDISDCYYGFPIALSYPHFLDSDKQLVTTVDGSRPNRSEHESYFMIQPVSNIFIFCNFSRDITFLIIRYNKYYNNL